MASPLVLSLKKRKSWCGRKIKLLSPAKINLYLNILGKYYRKPSISKNKSFCTSREKFHRIESIVERVSLFDRVTIEAVDSGRVTVSSNIKNLQGDANICFKAAQILKSRHGIGYGFNIHLEKNIPVGAGLGGGSSNAASVLLGLNILLNLRLSIFQLYELGAELGSDINFFLSDSRFALVTGRGQIVKPLEGRGLRHHIIWPAVNLSTKQVYKNTRAKLTKFFSNVKILRYALKKSDLPLIRRSVYNALEKGACSLCKEIVEAKKILSSRGILSKVTGSGSAVYTIYEKKDSNRIKRLLPKNWLVFPVKTF